MNDIARTSYYVGPGDPDEWPYPTITIESEVTGELRDKILAKTGRDGTVTLLETEVSGGWSEYTPETDYNIEVLVDGSSVWQDTYNGSPGTAMGAFLKWVEEPVWDL